MQRAVTQRHSTAVERPALRLRHQDGGKNELYDSPSTPQVLRELVTWFVVDRRTAQRLECAEMSNSTNDIAEDGV